jgi:S-layer homology domain
VRNRAVAARLIIALTLIAGLVAAAPTGDGSVAAAQTGPAADTGIQTATDDVVDLSDDIVVLPEPPADHHFRLFAAAPTDPLGLVQSLDQIQLYSSLPNDTFEMWVCGSSDLATKVTEADTFITPFYEWLSHDAYSPDFVAGGTMPGSVDCDNAQAVYDYMEANTSGTANGVIALVDGGGGFATPGFYCWYPCSAGNQKFPWNARYGFVGVDLAFLAVLAHEMGHMLHWPHSYTGNRFEGLAVYQYDNAIDLMSGNRGVYACGGTCYGTYPDPFATPAINRYAAGWIDTGDVAVHGGGTSEYVLVEIGDAGTEMLVLHDGDGYWTLDTRIASGDDPFPTAWEGVHVAYIDRSAGGYGTTRRTIPEPPNPFMDTIAEYSQPLDHVLHVGDSMTVDSSTIEVVARQGDSYRVRVTSTRFTDVPTTHTFYNDIEYLADEAITKGCNPPTNTMYCPNNFVTRGQMAAFLVRALNLPAATQDWFDDDDGTTFENDINRLAEAGITKGCNPPTNDRYCPDNRVTRGQMAAFLVRAFGYTDNGGGDLFDDDDGSVFENDIDKLGTAGVTKGCNPPSNTMYCPNNNVTRAQMAAFLHRALTG